MIRLGIRLAFSGGRPARVRSALMATGVALGVVLLLAALSVVPALNARESRVLSRSYPASREPGPGEPYLLWFSDESFKVDADEIVKISVAASGPGALAPLGAKSVPTPGSVLVSPALRKLLATPEGAQYQALVPGPIVGDLGPEVLDSPDDLVVMVGWHEPELARVIGDNFESAYFPGGRIVEFDGYVAKPFTDEGSLSVVQILMALFAFAVLIPIAAFLGASVRLSSTRREARLAALRLAGGTAREVTAIAIVEVVAAALIGIAMALVSANALRALILPHLRPDYFNFDTAYALPDTQRFFPGDFAPPIWQVVTVVLLVPTIAAVWAALAMRRIPVAPIAFEAANRSRRMKKRRGKVALAVLGVALSVLIAEALWWEQGLGIALALLLLPVVMIVGGPPLVRATGGRLAANARHGSALLAGRRLAASPTAGYRAVIGITVGIFAATIVLMFVIPMTQSVKANDYSSTTDGFNNMDVQIVDTAWSGSDVTLIDVGTKLESIQGVDRLAVYLMHENSFQSPDASFSGALIFGNCTEAVELVLEVKGLLADGGSYSCPDGQILASKASGLRPGTVAFFAPLGAEERIELPIEGVLPELPGKAASQSIIVVPLAAPLEGLGSEAMGAAFVDTDGRPETAQRVVAYAQTLKPSLISATKGEVRPSYDPVAARRLGSLGLLLMILVAGCSLAVTTADAILERRRAFAALTASGVPTRFLRQAVAIETLAPLATSLIVATSAGALVSAAGISLARSETFPGEPGWPSLSWAPLPWLFLAGILVGLLTVAVTLPFVGRAASPESLRTT